MRETNSDDEGATLQSDGTSPSPSTASRLVTDGGTAATPLPNQQRCPNGHLCGSGANYCRVCGADLTDGDAE